MASDPLDFAVDLDDVRDRLLLLQYFVSVTDVADAVQAIEDFPAVPPAAYVSIASETAQPNQLIGGHAQRVLTTISVLFCEQAARQDRDTRDRMEATRKAIIRQLIAWTPNRAAGPLQYARYLLRASGDGLVWGEVLFSTSYRVSI